MVCWFSFSLGRGVGQRRTAVASPSPLSGEAPLRLWLPYTVTVGHDEEAISLVRGADGGSGYTVPERIEPERGKVSKNTSEPARKERWHVLHKRDSGS